MLCVDDRRKVRLLASMSVGTRRAMGKDAATIRRESLAVAVKAIERHIDGQGEQETWLAEMERAVDREIARTA